MEDDDQRGSALKVVEEVDARLRARGTHYTLNAAERDLMVRLVMDQAKRTLAVESGFAHSDTSVELMRELSHSTADAKSFALMMAWMGPVPASNALLVADNEMVISEYQIDCFQFGTYKSPAMEEIRANTYARAAHEIGARGGAVLEWPAERWDASPEKNFRKQHGIVAFLRRVWKPFIDDNNLLVTRGMLATHDPSAALAVKEYVRANDLPDDIRIVRTRDVNKLQAKGATLHIRPSNE